MRKWTIIAAALIAFAAGAVILAFPAAATVMCPACYGFDRLEGSTFVQHSMPAEARARVAAVMREARADVGTFYGEHDDEPRVLVCMTDQCYRPIGGISHGVAFLDVALVLSPRGTDAVIAAHELSHIVFHHKVGRIRAYFGAVPSWFDEGLAVNVSNDPRYLAPAGAASRCLSRSDSALPMTRKEWVRNGQNAPYAAAACRVSEWMSAHGGKSAVLALAGDIAKGEPFAQAFDDPFAHPDK